MARLEIVCDGCRASFEAFQCEAGSAGYDDLPSHHTCLFCGRPLKTPGVTVRGDGSSREVRVDIVNPVYPCLYRSDDDLCRLHRQREERRLRDDEWRGTDRPGRCVFAGTDCITGKSCPAFNVTAPGEIKKGAYARHPEEMSQTPVHGTALERSHPLLRSRQEFGHDDIQFCAQEGVITSSFCVYCRNYTGKHTIGDREKRRADACRQACVTLGRIGEDRVEFFSQWVIDEMRSDRGYNDFFPVPVPANYIKSAFNTEATEWDRHQYTYHHCMRCNATNGVHHHCHDCGTRRLCDECVENRSETPETDGSVTISFRCPDCGAANAYNGGKFGWGETRFDTNDLPHSRLREPFVEINYWTLKERAAGFWCGGDDSAAHPITREACQDMTGGGAPSDECRFLRISSGLMKGLYAIDEGTKRAWLHVGEDYEALPVRGAVSPYEPYAYTVEAVLSYRRHDLEQAMTIKTALFQNDMNCVLVQEIDNIFDAYWGVRYATLIQRAKSVIVVPSEHYFEEESATMAELEELKAIAAHRSGIGDDASQLFFFWNNLDDLNDAHDIAAFQPIGSGPGLIDIIRNAQNGVSYFATLRGDPSPKPPEDNKIVYLASFRR